MAWGFLSRAFFWLVSGQRSVLMLTPESLRPLKQHADLCERRSQLKHIWILWSPCYTVVVDVIRRFGIYAELSTTRTSVRLSLRITLDPISL